MANYKTLDVEKYTVKAQSDKALYTLKGILQGIAIDSAVNVLEIDELTNWLSLHGHEQPFSPFKEIFPIIDAALADGILEPEELQDIIWACDQFDNGKYFEYATLSLQYLHGLFHGVLADNKLTDTEIRNLSDWLDDNQEFLAGTYPFDEVCSLISSILQDGIITEDERKTLFAFMGEFIDCTESYNISQAELDELREKYSVSGICAMQPDVVIEDKIFCFTGDSCRASRSEIEEIIKKAGGKFRKSVSGKTDYLVVGNEGSSCWAFSCYGRKVETAIELRKAGGKIQIIHENDFWDAILD